MLIKGIVVALSEALSDSWAMHATSSEDRDVEDVVMAIVRARAVRSGLGLRSVRARSIGCQVSWHVLECDLGSQGNGG